MKYLLGIDLGSSSIKIALIEKTSGKSIGIVQVPETEMSIEAIQKGWAEQDPEAWWNITCTGIKKIITQHNISSESIEGIGIAYQMHGLVLIDKQGDLLRKAIIWCDSRAVEVGKNTYKKIGEKYCNEYLLNSPANFTVSKLAWVKENEPELYEKTYKFMLPGDYIAYRFSNKINTTVSGLSEGVFWDFKNDETSQVLLEHHGINKNLIPDIVETFSIQSHVSKKGAQESGLSEGTPILYRAGDQPNNALSLNVFNVGEVATTGGTSGVMYAVTDSLSVKECERVNNFVHVNYEKDQKRIGKLLCVNSAGIQYRWLLNNLDVDNYTEMNALASTIPVGSEGLVILPFGNGAERMLSNKNIGTQILHLDLNRHHKGHLYRAALEGIAFSFVYGFEIMRSDGVQPKVIRTGNDNLFRSEIFSETIATLIKSEIEIYDTTGAIGAARACTLIEKDFEKFSSFIKTDLINTITPKKNKEALIEAYGNWKHHLNLTLKQY